jgi:Skp family chaperone for outer membrane proteins
MDIRKPGLSPARIVFAIGGAIVAGFAANLAAVVSGLVIGDGLALIAIIASVWIFTITAEHRGTLADHRNKRRRDELLRRVDNEDISHARPLPPPAQEQHVALARATPSGPKQIQDAPPRSPRTGKLCEDSGQRRRSQPHHNLAQRKTAMRRILCHPTLVAIVLAGQAAAQEVAPKPDNRLAVVDIAKVFLNYEKAKAFKVEMEKTLQPFKDRADKIKAEITKLQAQHDAATDPAVQATLVDSLAAAKRKLEALDRTARQHVGKQQEEQLIKLYKEVHGAIKGYADEHGIQIVFGYGEPPQQEVFSFTNVNRKLSAMDVGAWCPSISRRTWISAWR